MASRIAGIALLPRESRNGIYYDTEELKKFDGVTVPLRVEHGGPKTNIGTTVFKYDEEKQQVNYEATIENEEWQRILSNEQFQVSIGASVLEQRELCDAQKAKCLNSPVLKEIIELSVVRTPGIPESTLNVIESKNVLFEKIINEQDPATNFQSFGGLVDSQGLYEDILMGLRAKNPDLSPEDSERKAKEILDHLEKAFLALTQEPTQVQPAPEPAPVSPQPDDTPTVDVQPPPQPQNPLPDEPLPTDEPSEPVYQPEPPLEATDPINTSLKQIITNQTMTDDIKSEKTENVEEKVKVTIETDGEVEVADKKEATPAKEEAPAKEDVAERIEKSNERTLKAVIETVKEAWQPKSEVAEAAEPQGYVEEAFTDEDAKAFFDKVFENGYARMSIDKEGWIEAHTQAEAPNGNGSVHEAVSTSGTIPGTKLNSGISIQNGGKSAKPIRQFGQFQTIPVGQNTARFYRIDVPDAASITEAVDTDISAVTHTLTSTDITCAVRGWRQVVLRTELEDYPSGFLNALRETARIEAIRDEHKLIVEDLAGTDHDFGGTTTAPYHINAADGTAVVDIASEDATGEFDEDGISFAKRYLEELGQDTSPGKLIAFISPRAFESLMTATSLSEYAQIGNTSVTRLGQLERIYGVDIVVSNELFVQNNSTRNLVCVKGKSWGLVSQRKMDLEFQKTVSDQNYDIVWTHRIGVDILDPNTYVIVSSKQD